MKKLVLFFVMVMIIVSCTKQENLIPDLNIEAIRSQMVAAQALTVSQVQDVINPKLKDGPLVTPVSTTAVKQNLVQVLDLDQRTYRIYDTYAVKNFILLEIDASGNRTKFLTVHQIFDVVNGNIVANKFRIEYEVGYSDNKNFGVDVKGEISQVVYFLHFSDGRQLSYYGNNGGNIKIYPIANCTWQLRINFWDGDFGQEFSTNLMDYYNQSNIFNLRLEVKSDNVLSTVQIDKSFIYGAYSISLEGVDLQGNYHSTSIQVSYDVTMPSKISFSTYFDIKTMTIYGVYGSNTYYTNKAKVSPASPIGKKIYVF